MRRATLIVNPQAGRGSSFQQLQSDLLRTLVAHGFNAAVQLTTPDPDSARNLAASASAISDLVLVCGGDGTVHGVVQGLAGTATPLGVLPFGTANALARNLSLPIHPVQALHRLLRYSPQRIALGHAETPTLARHFAVMAGAGPDGTLVREMQLGAKAFAGRTAYYAEAARLFLTRRFPRFSVAYRPVHSTTWKHQLAAAVMVSRVPNLGGLFSRLTAASRLHHPHLLLHLLPAPAHLTVPAWFAFARLGLGTANPWLSTLAVEELRCSPLGPATDVHAQADAEPIGPLPLKLSVAASALTLLMPPPA